MLFADQLVVVRGGGDLASGVAVAMHRAGFPVVVLELEHPLAVRRAVSFAAAVHASSITIEEVTGHLARTPDAAATLAARGEVAVHVSESMPQFATQPVVVVDARMAKDNLDTSIAQAPLVVALGPGFRAGIDCDAVIETQRGHRLGRVIWNGFAAPDTGVPGSVGGATTDRIIRAPGEGDIAWVVDIGDLIAAGDPLGTVGEQSLRAATGGVVRGLIAPGTSVKAGMKIGDIDPRSDPTACFEISDKSRLVGAGVLAATLSWLNREEL